MIGVYIMMKKIQKMKVFFKDFILNFTPFFSFNSSLMLYFISISYSLFITISIFCKYSDKICQIVPFVFFFNIVILIKVKP